MAQQVTLVTTDSLMVIDATPQENHSHALQVTEHPVEQGADIADHARIKADVLSLECYLSDGATPGRSSDLYERLRLLQDTATLITVITTLRTYERMILESLSAPRTAKEAGGLKLNANFKQIELVQNKTTVVTVTKDPITKKKVPTGKQPTQEAADGAQKQKSWAKQLKDSDALGKAAKSLGGLF